jgi:hypothetical protein
MNVYSDVNEAIREGRLRSHRSRFEDGRVAVLRLEDGSYVVVGPREAPTYLGRENHVGSWDGGNCWSAGALYSQDMVGGVDTL